MHQHQHQQHHSRHHHRRRTNMTTGGMFLPDAWMSLTQNLQMQSITTSYQHLSTQYIDQVVDIEMKRLKANCKREEDRYVEQMLLENPIIVERRTLSPTPTTTPTPTTPPTPQPATRQSASVQSTQSPAAATDATPKTNDNNYQQHSTGNGSSSNNRDGNKEEWRATTALAHAQTQERQLLQQRAESCRRSRINNKIKKAKMKFRHKFMSNKLMQSVGMLECIQKLIDQTETQLVSQGFTGQQLEKLKEIFCSGRV